MENNKQEARNSLMEWVRLQHQHQKIRRSGAPYFSHVLAVAEMADQASPLAFEIGLCHDLLEDTPITSEQLQHTLLAYGYDLFESEHVVSCVLELTDQFTKTKFPSLNKKRRKKKETARLLTIHPDAQSVKYCDLIYNTLWMKKYDEKGFEKYLIRKSKFVEALDGGDPELRTKALSLMHKELELLK